MLISNWRDFADATVETHDLDPTYDFLYAARMDLGEAWAARFAVHYLMFYDLGGAARCADHTEDKDFWNYITHGYHLFKRGTERRHSRGKTGAKYVYNMSFMGSPLEIIEKMWAPDLTKLTKKIETDFVNCGFGPYFIWKVMDFQDRIFGNPVSLSMGEVLKFCPNEPRKCAAAVWPDVRFDDVIENVSKYIARWPAPGEPGGKCWYAEAETVLCMMKGFFLTRTHTIGDDVDTKWSQLRDFPHLHKYLPPQLDWSIYERPRTVDTPAISADLFGVVHRATA